MSAAFAVEWLKFRRSTICAIATLGVVAAVPGFAIGMTSLARSGTLDGPSTDKFAAALDGTVTEAHFLLAGQIVTVVMFLATGFVSIWLFGREHADGTTGALYARAVSRSRLAWAKVLLATTWCVAAVSAAVALTIAGSTLVSAAGPDTTVLDSAVRIWVAGVIMGWLGITFGLIATVARGYLGAVAGLIAATAVGQILASIGWGAWVPYVAPAMWVGAGGADAAAAIGVGHLVLAVFVAGAGAVGTAMTMGRQRLS